MKKILITGIGGDIAQGVASIIREKKPDCRLVGVDVHEQHGGRLFVDEFATIPSAGDRGYLDALRDVIYSKDVDVVIPMSEPELGVIGPLADELGENQCITAGSKVIEAGIDKLATVSALANLGLPTPWTTPVSGGLPQQYPCILKSRFGSGSRTVFVVKDQEEAFYLASKYPDAIFQELLEPADREITCAVYRSREGNVASLLMWRRLTGGFTGWAKVIEDAATSLMCESIAQGLDLRGSMNIQLRLTEHGPRVFEINPRFSSTVLMRHRIGFSDLLWALDEAEGKKIDLPEISPGPVLVRIQGATVMNLEGATRQ